MLLLCCGNDLNNSHLSSFFFPSSFVSFCSLLFLLFVFFSILIFLCILQADVVCFHLDFCSNQTCRMWPLPTTPLPPSFTLPTTKLPAAPAHRAAHKISVLADAKSGENYPGKSQETPWQWIEDLLNRMNKDHEPIIDMDHDNFSGTSLLFLSSFSFSTYLFFLFLFCLIFCSF